MESGSLGPRGVASALRALCDREETGRLEIVRGDERAALWLRDGAVYTAQAPEARARLGDRLVGAGELSSEQLEGALAAQRDDVERRRIGELLVERGAIDRATLRHYVQAQILDSVTATLAWRDGEWTFVPGEETAEDTPLDMSLENLLMDAARRLEQWEVIRAELGSLDAVVDFTPRKTGAEVALTPDEWSLMTQIDGAATITEIAEQAGYGQFETARIMYGLVTAGIVRTLEDEQHAPRIDRESLLAEFSALGAADTAPVGRPERPDPSGPDRPDRQDRTSLPAPGHSERRGLLDRFRKG